MGVYAEKVVPHVINFACGMKVTRPHRARVCEDLTGEVIELGFGSGHNVPYYPDTVTRVTAIEPSDVGWRLSEQRRRQSHVPIARGGLDGQSLPYPDGSFDSALSTWTLCTIPDPTRRCWSCAGCSSRAASSTSWSTGWPRRAMCASAPGNTAWSRCRSTSSPAAT
ncbi:class I SAM-dependent methyltransferase [Streptacidiphilus monticola]